MPLTASKTDADTSATTRVLASGLVPPAITELFMTPIHSSTGSGAAADTGKGLATSNAIITIRIALRTVVPASWRRTNAKKPGKLQIMCPPRARRQRGCELAHVCEWQISRQRESATAGYQLVGSRGEFPCFYSSRLHKSS